MLLSGVAAASACRVVLILRRISSPLTFHTKRRGFWLRAARKPVIAAASSRVEAKLFSVMNAFSVRI